MPFSTCIGRKTYSLTNQKHYFYFFSSQTKKNADDLVKSFSSAENPSKCFCFRFIRMAGPRDSPNSPLPSPRGVPGGSSPRGMFGGSSPRGVSPNNCYQSPGVGPPLWRILIIQQLSRHSWKCLPLILNKLGANVRQVCAAIFKHPFYIHQDSSEWLFRSSPSLQYREQVTFFFSL